MSSDKQHNEVGSGTTWPSEPHLDARGSERDFLDRQTEEAELAISAMLRDLADGLKDLGDLKEWTKEYPFVAVGSAGLLGYFMARSILPGNKLPAEQTTHAKACAEGGPASVQATGNETTDARGFSELRSMLSTVLQMATTAAFSAIQNAVAYSESKADLGSTNPDDIPRS